MVFIFRSFKFGVCLRWGWGARGREGVPEEEDKKKRVGYNAVFDYFGQRRTKLSEKLFAKIDFFE